MQLREETPKPQSFSLICGKNERGAARREGAVKKMNYYLAPMEGITGYIYRNACGRQFLGE